MTRYAFPLLAAMLLAPLPLPAVAQGQGAARAPTRIPVTIALVDREPSGGETWVIQRRPDIAPNDVILLRSTADAGQLGEAVRTLLVVRQADGDRAVERRTLRIRPEQRQRGGRAFPWVPRVLADLRRAEPREIAGVGTVRAVEIWLPPQHGRTATR